MTSGNRKCDFRLAVRPSIVVVVVVCFVKAGKRRRKLPDQYETRVVVENPPIEIQINLIGYLKMAAVLKQFFLVSRALFNLQHIDSVANLQISWYRHGISTSTNSEIMVRKYKFEP